MLAIIGNSLISKLKPKNKPYDVRDSKLTGFFIRVNISGKLVYMCEYARGKRVTIGKVGVLTPMQARDMAKEILADAVKGNELSLKKPKKDFRKTLRTFLDNDYGPWVIADRKSGVKTLRLIQTHFKEFFDLPLKEVKPIIIEKWRTEKERQGCINN